MLGPKCFVTLLVIGGTFVNTDGKLNSDMDSGDTGEHNPNDIDSGEKLGASVTQVYKHPYAASLLRNNSYVCSAVILNTWWLITMAKCFDSNVITSYITYSNLQVFTMRVGSSYNSKGGSIYKIKMLANNFDMKISAVKLAVPMEFGSRVAAVRLPSGDEGVNLGYLVNIVAWTPNGHMRLVSAPAIDSQLCESFTHYSPGYFICVGGVQDPRRQFCRRDNGGAVIQNNTLVAISSFIQTCALYSKTHAFPKISAIAGWLDKVIWDENNRRTTRGLLVTTSKATTKVTEVNATEIAPEGIDEDRNPYFSDPKKYMLTLPFDLQNVPLEPSEDNSVIPRVSLYESYLHNLARKKTSTTPDPATMRPLPAYDQRSALAKKEWIQKINKAFIMMPPPAYTAQKYDTNYDYV